MPGSSVTGPLPSGAPEEESEALARVRRGELPLDAYLENLVEMAIAHLQGRMPEGRLDIVRNVARNTLREAPEYQEAIRSLTGQTPGNPSESS